MKSVEPHSVKDSPLGEAASRSAVQLILQTACNPHSRYGYYNNPTVIRTQGVEYSTKPHLLNIHFTNILRQSFPSGISSLGLPTTTLYEYLI